MKITKAALKQLIKEETEKLLLEQKQLSVAPHISPEEAGDWTSEYEYTPPIKRIFNPSLFKSNTDYLKYVLLGPDFSDYGASDTVVKTAGTQVGSSADLISARGGESGYGGSNLKQFFMDIVGAKTPEELPETLTNETLFKTLKILFPLGGAAENAYKAAAARLPNLYDSVRDSLNVVPDPGTNEDERVFGGERATGRKGGHDWMSDRFQHGRTYEKGPRGLVTQAAEMPGAFEPHGPGVDLLYAPYTSAEGTSEYARDPVTGYPLKP